MRIFVFALHYPVPYKPYYDTQFADFVEQGHELTVFSAGPLDGEVVHERVRRYGLDRRARRIPFDLRSIPRSLPAMVTNGMRRFGPAIRGAGRVFRSGAEGGWKRRVKDLAQMLVLQEDRPDLCLVHGLGTATNLPSLPAMFPDVPLGMYYHGGEIPTMSDLGEDVVRNTFDGYDLVFTNTRFSARQAIERGCDPDRIRILPVGFSLEDYAPPEGKHAAEGPVRIVSAGRLSTEKGYAVALEALRDLEASGEGRFEYRIIGDGYRREALEELVSEYGLEGCVSFLGAVPHDRVREEMGRAQVLLLPSFRLGNWAETQACTVQEAMLQECIPIVSRIGGVVESIPPDVESLSVPQKDSGALRKSLEKVLGMDPAERETLASESRSWVRNRYDIRELNRRMIDELTGATEESVEPARDAGSSDPARRST